MTVIAAHPLGDKDVSAAEAYGQIDYVNARYVYADELEGENLPSSLTSRMERAVDKFDPDHDFLLIAGDHLQIVALAAMLAARWGTFKVLRFDRVAQGYLAVRIDTLDAIPIGE